MSSAEIFTQNAKQLTYLDQLFILPAEDLLRSIEW